MLDFRVLDFRLLEVKGLRFEEVYIYMSICLLNV